MNKASPKLLIRYSNYLQDLSTLFLQGAFFFYRLSENKMRIWYNEVTCISLEEVAR